jgi:hypothetical protein
VYLRPAATAVRSTAFGRVGRTIIRPDYTRVNAVLPTAIAHLAVQVGVLMLPVGLLIVKNRQLAGGIIAIFFESGLYFLVTIRQDCAGRVTT